MAIPLKLPPRPTALRRRRLQSAVSKRFKERQENGRRDIPRRAILCRATNYARALRRLKICSISVPRAFSRADFSRG